MKQRKVMGIVVIIMAMIIGGVLSLLKFGAFKSSASTEAILMKQFDIMYSEGDDYQEETQICIITGDGTVIDTDINKEEYVAFAGTEFASRYIVSMYDETYKQNENDLYVAYVKKDGSIEAVAKLEDRTFYSYKGSHYSYDTPAPVGTGQYKIYFKTDKSNVKIEYDLGLGDTTSTYSADILEDMKNSAYEGYVVADIFTGCFIPMNIRFFSGEEVIDDNQGSYYQVCKSISSNDVRRYTIADGVATAASPNGVEYLKCQPMIGFKYDDELSGKWSKDTKVVVTDKDGNEVFSQNVDVNEASYNEKWNRTSLYIEFLINYADYKRNSSELDFSLVDGDKTKIIGDLFHYTEFLSILPGSATLAPGQDDSNQSYYNNVRIYYKTDWNDVTITYDYVIGRAGENIRENNRTAKMKKTAINGYYVVDIDSYYGDRLDNIRFSCKAGRSDDNKGEGYKAGYGYTYTYFNGKMYDGNYVLAEKEDTKVKIYYSTDWANCYAHYKINDGEWTKVPGNEMKYSRIGYKEIELKDARYTDKITVCFNNGEGFWDNNNQKDYVLTDATQYTIKNNKVYKGDPSAIPQNNCFRIYYPAKWDTTNIHYKAGDGSWTTVPGIAMKKSDVQGFVCADVNAGEAETLTACFNDGNGNWDSNYSKDYHFDTPGVYTVENNKVSEGTPMIPERNIAQIYYINENMKTKYIHYRVGSGKWTDVPGIRMDNITDAEYVSEDTSCGFAQIDLVGNNSLTFCFNDGLGNWDNNSSKDYTISDGGVYVVYNGKIVKQ